MKEGNVHRRLCEETNGPAPTPEHQAAHSCGNGHLGCVTKRHLSWKTPVQNAADKIGHGTRHRGEDHPLSKLTEYDVLAIRASTEPGTVLAERYGVSSPHISYVRSGAKWDWMPIKHKVILPKRDVQGSRNPNAKLNENQVREIRLLKGTATQKDIAKQFGVSHQTVSLLLRGEIWA